MAVFIVAGYVGVNAVRPVLRQYANGVDARLEAVLQRKINEPVPVAEWNGRLGEFGSKRSESASFAASQKHGQT